MSQNFNLYASDNRGTKVSVKNIELVKDAKHNEYSLDVTYIIDTPDRIQEVRIPRVTLPISPSSVDIFIERDPLWNTSHHSVNIGFGTVPTRALDGWHYTVRTIEEKTKEMTLEEIEKKLGHKVKIISEVQYPNIKEETK